MNVFLPVTMSRASTRFCGLPMIVKFSRVLELDLDGRLPGGGLLGQVAEVDARAVGAVITPPVGDVSVVLAPSSAAAASSSRPWRWRPPPGSAS